MSEHLIGEMDATQAQIKYLEKILASGCVSGAEQSQLERALKHAKEYNQAAEDMFRRATNTELRGPARNFFTDTPTQMIQSR